MSDSIDDVEEFITKRPITHCLTHQTKSAHFALYIKRYDRLTKSKDDIRNGD